MAGKLRLRVTGGPRAGKVFVFDQHDTLLVGRMTDCHVCLPDDPHVSRHHFLLEVNPPDARLRDLGSLAGTYVNGQKYGGRQRHETPEEGARHVYPQVDLHDGDEIKVGRTMFQVYVEAPVQLPIRVYCGRCHKDVSNEVNSARQGEYICEQCQRYLEKEPQALLAVALDPEVARIQQAIRLADYDIGEQIGVGGMGAVYLVKHKKTGEQAAIKVLLSKVQVDDLARGQFLREIETTRRLRHPYIVQFLGSGAAGSIFYILLEYCAGGSVAHLMRQRGGRLSLGEARPILLQALEGLAYVHAEGFVHRDLKPQNILLSGSPGQWVARISDLGLAKSFEQSGLSGMTATGDVSGSFPFMPREQLVNFKHVRPVCDIWAMGATCYNILTGTLPRSQQPEQDPIEAILRNEIIPLRQRAPHIPAQIAGVIDRALATIERDRYQHAGEMYEALMHAFAQTD
ncbi:MAG TPA: FHA domain-containing serine/threonine-protein kinase [Ktedonosporobacter sp.]|nr:FHA domain-containing serine/threonine-protein kinase [Ktedonosporobacter sp.]